MKLVEVKDWLEGLVWDGTPRVDTWASRFLASTDDAQAARLLIAAVARVFEPGCEIWQVPVLEGPQGCGKSTALRILGGAGFGEWTLPHDAKGWRVVEALEGAWLFELTDVRLTKRHAGQVADFALAGEDIARRPFQGSPSAHARWATFVITTNVMTQTIAEASRFEVIRVGHQVNLEALREAREQLWAEAVALYRAGRTWGQP